MLHNQEEAEAEAEAEAVTIPYNIVEPDDWSDDVVRCIKDRR